MFETIVNTKFLTLPNYRATYHAGIRSLLFSETLENGLIPIAEYNIKVENKNGRIDFCAFN